MTIQLPKDLESSINAEVLGGHFASVDDAITTIVREYFQREKKASPDVGESLTPTQLDQRPIWEVVDELRQGIPAEEFDKLPVDGARQLDHYLHGSPKRPTP